VQPVGVFVAAYISAWRRKSGVAPAGRGKGGCVIEVRKIAAWRAACPALAGALCVSVRRSSDELNALLKAAYEGGDAVLLQRHVEAVERCLQEESGAECLWSWASADVMRRSVTCSRQGWSSGGAAGVLQQRARL
jgi:hypothetical protein